MTVRDIQDFDPIAEDDNDCSFSVGDIQDFEAIAVIVEDNDVVYSCLYLQHYTTSGGVLGSVAIKVDDHDVDL